MGRATYNGTCTSSLALFNGGHHNLTLFVYHGRPLTGQPTECTIPGDHAAIDVRLARSRRGLTEIFTLSRGLLHPATGFDTPVIHAVLQISARQRALKRTVGGQTLLRRVGLFESLRCPPSHRRSVAITFIREDGVAQTGAAWATCA